MTEYNSPVTKKFIALCLMEGASSTREDKHTTVIRVQEWYEPRELVKEYTLLYFTDVQVVARLIRDFALRQEAWEAFTIYVGSTEQVFRKVFASDFETLVHAGDEMKRLAHEFKLKSSRILELTVDDSNPPNKPWYQRFNKKGRR